MKTILSLALATALFAGMANFAAAQEAQAPAQDQAMSQGESHSDNHGGKHGGGHHGKRGHGKRGGMMNIDANGDGVISDTEAANGAAFAFKHLDRNGDDAISQTEFTTGGHRHRSWASWFGTQTAEEAAILKLRNEKFVKLDADKNALVDKIEFMGDFKTRFTGADVDKDGKVTVWEFQMQK